MTNYQNRYLPIMVDLDELRYQVIKICDKRFYSDISEREQRILNEVARYIDLAIDELNFISEQ